MKILLTKNPCQTLTDTLTKLSKKNSSHHTHHRNVLLIIYTSYISLSPLTIDPDTSRTIFPPSLSNACRSNDAAHLKTKLLVVCRFDGTWRAVCVQCFQRRNNKNPYKSLKTILIFILQKIRAAATTVSPPKKLNTSPITLQEMKSVETYD